MVPPRCFCPFPQKGPSLQLGIIMRGWKCWISYMYVKCIREGTTVKTFNVTSRVRKFEHAFNWKETYLFVTICQCI